jgi:CheY-like chemotaxis protein/anti-sigma regulatory factor (Ser/Thr protein kinase)
LPNTPEARPLVSKVNASILALQDLLDALLDISRLDAGLITPRPTEFALADVFARLRLEFVGPAEARRLDLRVRPTDVWLNTDAHLLVRILMNFVSNALRYTTHGGVLVACRRRQGKALIEVWDTGIGIEPEHLQDIFSEYVQLDNPERNRAKGLGLGLAICERLSELLKLPLGVRSVAGRGSVFRIEVPLGQARSPAAAEAVASPASIEGAVAIIEDDATRAAGMVYLLAGWGCRTIGATSADGLMRRCDEAQLLPDMAICDCRLADGADGITAGLALRSRYGPIPVLLLTADVDDKLIVGAARRDFALLTKPVRPGKLRALVQQMLAQRPAG